MSLTLSRDTVSDKRPIFAKVFELFQGGFSFSAGALTIFTAGVRLPKGTLLQVDEFARTCKPVKRGRTAADSASTTAHHLEKGHLFQVGDYLAYDGTAFAITAIAEGATSDKLTITAALVALGTGITMYDSSATGDGAAVHRGTGNAYLAYDALVATGGSVTALRRGTVYTRRAQPVMAADNLPDGILFTTSR